MDASASEVWVCVRGMLPLVLYSRELADEQRYAADCVHTLVSSAPPYGVVVGFGNSDI